MMPRKNKHVGEMEGTQTMKVPLAAGALVVVILLMTISDVASAQAGTANIVVANAVQSILSPTAVDTGKRAIAIPQRPDLRSQYQPPSWKPGPPPWAPGKPDWVPGPPPWASYNKTNKAGPPASSKAKR